VNLVSISFAKIPNPILIPNKSSGEADLKNDRNLFNLSISDYLKKLSTNSYLLNTCKSSIPSPTPIYFTGIWN
jgi:hypothetical protein